MICGVYASDSPAQAEEVVSVPRKEWEAMKREMAEMRREMNQLKVARAPAAEAAAAPVAAPRTSAATPLAALSQRVTELAGLVDAGRPGQNQFLLTGEASANWSSSDSFHNNGFSAAFSPVLLWKLTDKLMFEGKVDFTLSPRTYDIFGTMHGGSDVRLDYAQLDWALDDHFTLVLGKFRSPMNVFAERYEPSWINRLPDMPLGTYDLLPNTNLGIQIRGALPLWYPAGKVTAAVFAANAPRYNVNSLTVDLDYDNFDQGKHNFAAGGRVGLQFCPNLELGYGWEYARAQPDNFPYGGASFSPTIPLWVHTVDLQTWMDALRGRWTLWAQYAWSDFQRSSVRDVSDPLSRHEFGFSRSREGGYAQISYRGTEWQSDVLNRLELIVRADRTERSGFYNNFYSSQDGQNFESLFSAPASDSTRITVGLDYWLTSYTVLKAAYEHGNSDAGDDNRLILGFATGL